jgi:hypothetical protein
VSVGISVSSARAPKRSTSRGYAAGQEVLFGHVLLECRRGVHDLAVPVPVVLLGQPWDDGAGADDVQIEEVERLRQPEVLRRDVAATHDGDVVVHDEQLVVHALVRVVERQERVAGLQQGPGTADPLRVEDADVHVWVAAERREDLVGVAEREVVDDQPNADAAIRRAQEPVQEQRTRRVTAPHVVLRVDARARGVGEAQPPGETVLSALDDVERRVVAVAVARRLREAGERHVGGGGVLREDAASGQRHECGHEERQAAAGRSAHRAHRIGFARDLVRTAS